MNMIPAQMQIPGLDMTANLHSVATEVLCLMNMVEVEELMDDEEYEGKSSTDVVLLVEDNGHLNPLLPISLPSRPLLKCVEEPRDRFEVEVTNLHVPFRKQVFGHFESVLYSDMMRGAVVRALAFHQCGPGSIHGSDVLCGLSLLVLFSAPRGFFPGTPVFPSHQKPTFDLICFDLC